MANFDPLKYTTEFAILRPDGGVDGPIPGIVQGISAKDYIMQAALSDWYFVGTLPHIALRPEAKEGDTVLVFRQELDPRRGYEEV
jgi:hypothetical protein